MVDFCLYFTVSEHKKLNVLMDDGDERSFALMVFQAGLPIRCMNILVQIRKPSLVDAALRWITYG